MLEKWLTLLTLPLLEWIQVEVTSYCNASCSYCPRTVLGDSWHNQHMALETFERISPALGTTRMVYLQGWGEPLLNPDLLAMVSLGKEAGCRVGTTTNGMLLDRGMARQLVASGLDVLSISLAGFDERNDRIRDGAGVARVWEAVSHIHEAKQALGKELPEIHVAFMLLKSGLDQLERLPEELSGRGISHVIISTLDLVMSRELSSQVVAPASVEDHEKLAARLDDVRARGARHGLEIHFTLRRPGEFRFACRENAHRALFVGVDGTVSPCVYLNVPSTHSKWATGAGSDRWNSLRFGSLGESSLARIWWGRGYRNFRRAFLNQQPPTQCQDCPKLDPEEPDVPYVPLATPWD